MGMVLRCIAETSHLTHFLFTYKGIGYIIMNVIYKTD